MKKLLALVLALVMTLSLAVVGSNAAFKDADKVNETYSEAVNVLSGMKVFQGYTDGSFQPKGAITRAEVAAIVYRLYTGDVADKQASLYATYNKFSDMDGAKWAAGYIGYCANAGLVKGYDAKTFGPADKVTGYQALAMILRAVGYDKNNEFTGADWQLHVAQYAQQLGVLKNVKNEDLNASASRELVAELLFRTAAYVPTVTYTAALGYNSNNSLLGNTKNDTLGKKNFGLTYTESTVDEFGRPYYVWFDSRDTKTGAYVSGTSTLYATVKATPVATYTTAVTECKIAEDYGFKATKDFTVYTNGAVNAAKKTLNATNNVATLGGQGTVVEVYNSSIAVIDTLLAEVVSVTPVRYDTAKHVVTKAKLTLKVFDAKDHSTTFVEESSSDFSYVVGDMLLLNAVQNVTASTSYVINTGSNAYIEILGKSESFVGAQTRAYMNASKHSIGGTDYNDNARFHLDQATTETINHNWWLDQYGNLIGATDIVSNNYAVLKYIRWNPSTAIGVNGYGEAVLVDMDGAESTVKVAKLDGTKNATTFSSFTAEDAVVTMAGSNAEGGKIDNSTPAKALVSHEASLNTNFMGYALYRVDTNMDGTVNLTAVEGRTTYVKYVAAASFSTNGSYITNSSRAEVAVSNNTKYLVRVSTATGFDYKAISGTQAIASYKSAELFYVDYNNDNVADYVYIKSGVETGAQYKFAYVLNNTIGLPNSTSNYYSVDLLIDGKVETVSIANTTEGAALVETLKNNVNKLFKVTYDVDTRNATTTYGYVTAAEKVTAAGADLDGKTFAAYVPLNFNTDGTQISRYYDGETLKQNNAAIANSYRVTDANSKVYVNGTESSTAALDANALSYDGIWVVYTKTVNNVASYVYVGAPLSTSTALTINATEGGVVAPKTGVENTSVFTNKVDATSDKLSFAYDKFATVTGVTSNPMAVTSTADTQNKTFTVKNEEGSKTATYTLEMKWDNKTVVAPTVQLSNLTFNGNKYNVKYGATQAIAAADYTKYVITIYKVEEGTNYTVASLSVNSNDTPGGGNFAANTMYDSLDIEVTGGTAAAGNYKVTMQVFKGETVIAQCTEYLAASAAASVQP